MKFNLELKMMSDENKNKIGITKSPIFYSYNFIRHRMVVCHFNRIKTNIEPKHAKHPRPNLNFADRTGMDVGDIVLNFVYLFAKHQEKGRCEVGR